MKRAFLAVAVSVACGMSPAQRPVPITTPTRLPGPTVASRNCDPKGVYPNIPICDVAHMAEDCEVCQVCSDGHMAVFGCGPSPK